MSILIPEKPSGQSTPAILRLFRILKKLPDDYTVWHNFSSAKPHFLVVSPTRNAFLIHVAETTEELAQSAIQLDLLDGSQALTPDTVAADELALLDQFPLSSDAQVRRLLVFPNASQGTLDQIVLQRSQETQVNFLSLKQSTPENFLSLLENLAGTPLPEPALYTLRADFTPETVIPSSHRPTLIEQAKDGCDIPAFLDLDQERLFKQDLLAPPPGEQLSATSRLVTGPAGSGKSLVLLHRAILAAQLHTGARLLVLTHNRPISTQLQQRFQEIAPKNSTVNWKTFFAWATSYLRPDEDIISDHVVRRRIASLQARSPRLADFQPDFLTDEIDYLRDLGISSLEEYLELERTGRLTALRGEAREAIWQLLLDYRAELAREKLLDWHEVALRFDEFAREKPDSFHPGYDFIFIDEAQFFAKIWFAPVLTALKPTGQLFLSADHTQGFLKRRQSWRDLGIDVVGRATRLARVYRSTQEVARCARNFFLTRQANDSVNDFSTLPDLLPSENLKSLPSGEPVHILQIGSPNRLHQYTAELVTRHLEVSPHLRGHILVIEADPAKAYNLRENLEKHLGPNTVRNLKPKPGERQPKEPLCQVASLHAATGLEATSVILLGLDSLLEKEKDPTLSPESADELRAAQTRLIYVALTRAIARLTLVTTNKEQWKDLLGVQNESEVEVETVA
ncbi:UvrD-helicase domain-containing protein [Roseibacillus persicicus]|uniref:UvrD-helicase domain-containing protein n=1 Tax=Roseibacillus persicicus TaxID=454148 RepID=UPI00280E8D98|nr:UvrD-helicase domain-containing protein [Roseibacillus persicicus]MDQ8190306.1 hypothetical protein [Roseibacillus persicicus]